MSSHVLFCDLITNLIAISSLDMVSIFFDFSFVCNKLNFNLWISNKH